MRGSGAGAGLAATLRLREHGHGLWLSYLRRSLLDSGALDQLIETDGVSGLSFDSGLFADLVVCGADYRAELGRLLGGDLEATQIVDQLIGADVVAAAAALETHFHEREACQGWVAVDLPSYASEPTAEGVEWWLRLRARVPAGNILLKVPATPAGLAIAREVLGAGGSVYLSHVFSPAHAEAVVDVYRQGLEQALDAGHRLSRMRGIAALNLVRIDIAVDEILRTERDHDDADSDLLESLMGRAALAIARTAWAQGQAAASHRRWRGLVQAGALSLQLAWEGTRTADPARRDVEYMEELIGPDSMAVVSRSLLAAFRQRGTVEPRLPRRAAEGDEVVAELNAVGVDLDTLADGLQAAAVRQERERMAALCNQLEAWRETGSGPSGDRAVFALGGLEADVAERMAGLDAGMVGRLFDADAQLWAVTPDAIEAVRNRMGWLRLPEAMREEALAVVSQAQPLRDEARTTVLLGMGGSSLGAETCKVAYEAHAFVVLDTTVPAAVTSLAERLDPAATTFIVASKSGATVETDALADYFASWAGDSPADGAGFLAVTDPGTPLHEKARNLDYARVWLNPPDVGGRYSVLSLFGLVPMALMGVDLAPLLQRATRMAALSAPEVPARDNPAVVLGVTLAAAVAAGCDKLTFITNRRLAAFADWAEQLIAESLGKQGLGLVPVCGEPLGDPGSYGQDRLFVRLRFSTDDGGGERASAWSALRQLGHPTVDIELGGPHDLGAEFFRWELAVAIAGSLLGINPFDEPDVAGAKRRTAELLEEFERAGGLPEPEPVFDSSAFAVFADVGVEAEIDDRSSLAGWLGGHLRHAATPDYVAIQAFLAPEPEIRDALQQLRGLIRDRLGVATTLGWGPRFLHSTGQLHKGGPDSGVFLQLTTEDTFDVEIPGRTYGFGVLARAQALGDLMALQARSRRVLRVHLRGDVESGLGALLEAADTGLSEKVVTR